MTIDILCVTVHTYHDHHTMQLNTTSHDHHTMQLNTTYISRSSYHAIEHYIHLTIIIPCNLTQHTSHNHHTMQLNTTYISRSSYHAIKHYMRLIIILCDLKHVLVYRANSYMSRLFMMSYFVLLFGCLCSV